MAESGLISGALPKSRAGRKAAELDAKLVDALVGHLTKTPVIKDEDGNDRPNFVGPATEFETQGKAASAGRRYAKASENKIGKTVRVNVYDNGKNEKAKKFMWRIYVPLSEQETTDES
jgi:hypothetical protein